MFFFPCRVERGLLPCSCCCLISSDLCKGKRKRASKGRNDLELTEKERARERQKRKESKKRERERERERERKREREKERERLTEEREKEKERERLREEREREKERERKEFSDSFEHFQGKKVVFTSLCSSPFLSRPTHEKLPPSSSGGAFARRGAASWRCGVSPSAFFFLSLLLTLRRR